jgi:hypothetical protein
VLSLASPMRYQIRVRRDVTTWAYFWIAFVLLLIPPILITIRSASFETARWAESDVGGSSSGSDSDSGDDSE